MYKDYFGLRELPFSIAPDPRYLFMSEQHRDALAHLVYGINSDGGFILLTGEVGTGKTTVCRCLLEQLPKDCDIAIILNPKVTAVELLATLCDELHIKYPPDNTSIKVFVDLINSYLLESHARGRKTVLIIDEAQNLEPDVLEQIRLLTNLETDQRKLLQIIMLGQPELREMLQREDLRQLSQRITARYHLGPLSKEDVPAYIAHRLAVGGIRTRLFPDLTMGRIFRITGGVPRLINVLCDRALLGAYAQGKEHVDTKTLLKAAEEVFGKKAVKSQFTRKEALAASLTAVFIVILISVSLLYPDGLRRMPRSQPAAVDSGSAPMTKPSPESLQKDDKKIAPPVAGRPIKPASATPSARSPIVSGAGQKKAGHDGLPSGRNADSTGGVVAAAAGPETKEKETQPAVVIPDIRDTNASGPFLLEKGSAQ